MATTQVKKREWMEDGSRLFQEYELTWDNGDLTHAFTAGPINVEPLYFIDYATTAQTAGTVSFTYSTAQSTGIVTVVARADTAASVAALVTRHVIVWPALASQNGTTSGNMPG